MSYWTEKVEEDICGRGCLEKYLQGGAKVGLQLYVKQSLFLYYYLLITVFFFIEQLYIIFATPCILNPNALRDPREQQHIIFLLK